MKDKYLKIPDKDESCNALIYGHSVTTNRQEFGKCNGPESADIPWCYLVYTRLRGFAAFVRTGTCPVTHESIPPAELN